MKTVWKYLRKYWLPALLASAFMIGEVYVDLYQPRMMAVIVDQGILGLGNNGISDMNLILSTGIRMLLISFLLVLVLEWDNPATLGPMPVGEKLLINPSWYTDTDPQGRVVLNIDPGLAFGTGKHETTRLCMEALERYVKGGERVLDVGCGSGALTIACAKNNPNAKMVGVDRWGAEYASFSKELFAAADVGLFVLNEYFSTIRNSVPFSTLFFRAPCFRQFRNDYSFVMKFDVQLILELLLADKVLGRIPRVLAQYRIHKGQTSSTSNARTIYTYTFFESIPHYSTFLTTQNARIMRRLMLTTEDDIDVLHTIAALHFLRSSAIMQHISGYLFIHNMLNTENGRALLQEKFGFSIADFRAMLRSNTYIYRFVENDINKLGIKGTAKALVKKIMRKVFKEKLSHS